MDETDVRLCQNLFSNSRIPVRELADRLNISIQATHRRMQNLRQEGIIHRYMSFLSVGYLRAFRAYMSGRTEIADYSEVKRILRGNDRVHVVLVSGEHLLHLSFILREVGELDDAMGFAKNDLRIPDPRISIESQIRFGGVALGGRYTGPPELSRVDYRIVRALQEDSRKAVEEVAGELNLSARTVKRHLDRMTEDGAIEFGLDWNPAYSTGITSLIMVKAGPGVLIGKIMNQLNASHGGSIIFINSFSNLPDIVGCYSWTPTVMRQKELVDAIGKMEGVEFTMSALLEDGWVQETWRDRLLRERAGAKG